MHKNMRDRAGKFSPQFFWAFSVPPPLCSSGQLHIRNCLLHWEHWWCSVVQYLLWLIRPLHKYRQHSSVSSGLAFPPKNSQGAFKYQHFTEEKTRNKNAASISLNEGNGASLGQEHLLQDAVTPSLQVQWIKQTEKLRKQQRLTKLSLVRKIQTTEHHIGFSM